MVNKFWMFEVDDLTEILIIKKASRRDCSVLVLVLVIQSYLM